MIPFSYGDKNQQEEGIFLCEREKEPERNYENLGCLMGHPVNVSYAQEGPNLEEALALYREARGSLLYQNLASAAQKRESMEQGSGESG